MEFSGLAAFATIKYFGYFLYLKVISPKENTPNLYVIAFARLIAGLVVGMSIHAIFTTGRDILPVYISAILIGRVAIWYAIFHIFYKTLSVRKKVEFTIGGTFVSYILDIPAVIGLWVIVGGIC